MLTKFTALAPLRVREELEGPRGPAVCERGPCRRGTRSSTAPEQGTGRRANNVHEYRSKLGTLIFPRVQIRSCSSERSSVQFSVMASLRAECAYSQSLRALKDIQARVIILRIDHQRQPSPFPTFLVIVYENNYMEIPYLMPNCKSLFKKRTVKMRRPVCFSRCRRDALFWSPVVDLCSSSCPLSVVFGPLLI